MAIDLKTRYMGLNLANPLIVASSGITQSVDGVSRCADAGAGAVVLKSVFEEQITAEVRHYGRAREMIEAHPEAEEYLDRYGYEAAFGTYLRLIREAKQTVSIPVIASIHCTESGAWTEYADRVQQAGADALELNVFVLPSDPKVDGRDYEKIYFDIARAVQRQVSVPVSLKIGTYFSALARTATQLSRHVDALVLFNRFYRVDFDIEEMKVVPAGMFSTADELTIPLRWISILSGQVECDLAATTGVHDGTGLIKQLLAGASAVQICSALYRNRDVTGIRGILEDLTSWMERHSFESIEEFRGKMSQSGSTDPAAYERVQFMIHTENRPL